ncbi:hypothetical protein D3C87_1805880 [compost metagenome]
MRRVVPLVDGGGDIQPLVTLKADQGAIKGAGQHLGNLGLADTGLAFEKERALHPERQKQHRRQRLAGEIILCLQHRHRFIDGLGQYACRRCRHESSATANSSH